jgi:GH15 family glucan-1,4-alpha-glucosidase
MLGYANHLGLHPGNFPQAFTHFGLISAAYNLNKQLNDSRNKDVNGIGYSYL